MPAPGMDRLARAMSIWLDNQSSPRPRPAAELLAAHEDLRDLLEPMVHDGDESGHGLPPDPSGHTLDDFRLVREIGRGGMGIVYEALQLSLDRRVAIKLLPSTMHLPPLTVARFKREALTTARLDHPGIVKVLAVGESEQGYWFAMELLDGCTLDEYARGCRSDGPDTAVRCIVDAAAAVAEALAHAHRAGVVHRDIKPSNVLVRPDGQPVITDFGVARANTLPSMTQAGELTGTPFYVSPEQIAGQPADARSDVFALGVTLYELLTGQRPFDGSSSRIVLDQIVRRDPPSPDRIDRELPPDLSAIVLKALEKEPARRYDSAAAMAADLRRFLDHRPVLAQPIGALGRLRRWVAREPLKAALAAALLVGVPIVAGLTTYVWWTQQATDIGRSAMRATRVEEILLDAVLSRLTVGGNKRAELVPRALELAPDDPYVLANCAIYYAAHKQHGPAHALRLLGARAAGVDDPGLHRIEAWLRRKLADPESRGVDVSELEDDSRSALDAYVLSELAMNGLAGAMRAGDSELRRSCAQKAKQFALRAIGQSPRPRSQYFVMLNRAARCLEDGDSVLIASDAMTEHWPNSAGAWVFRAMAWNGFRPDSEIGERAARRSLELSPDNFVGLQVLANLAEQRGDSAQAEAHRARMEQLYPDEMAWQRGETPHTGR